MFANAFQSSLPAIPSYVRASAEVRGTFARAERTTKLIDTFETGGLRLRTPKAGEWCEAVVLNTAGGLAGGDEVRMSFVAASNANVCITTQSAEKIYRAEDRPVMLAADIHVGDGASLVWMPQETILFDGSGLERSLTIEMAENASVLAVESTVFGRVARGERLSTGVFRDRWRIRRGAGLVFADDVRLAGAISEIAEKAAVGNGACAVATLVFLAPDAEDRLPMVRSIVETDRIDGGASAWNGMLIVRLAGRDPFDVRSVVTAVLRQLSRIPLPRVWSI